jgi:hypothetical protein
VDDLIAFLAARVGARQALIMQAVNKAQAGDAMNRGETKVAVEQKIRGLTDLDLDAVNQMINEIEATRRRSRVFRSTAANTGVRPATCPPTRPAPTGASPCGCWRCPTPTTRTTASAGAPDGNPVARRALHRV